MKLQFLIPQYDETEEVIAPLLKSIEIQQGIDVKNEVGAIIVNDGSDTILSDDFINSFGYDIQYIKNEHKGVSATRNAALDAATADYVCFCDADDMFFNMCGLWIVFREMNGSGFNVLVSSFIEETKHPETKELTYITHNMDSTFVHGKFFSRKYLKNKQIRWNDNLTIHEDSYFNALAQRLTKEVKFCQQPFYLWKWRDASVCRHDPKYILKTYNNMLESSTALAKELMARDLTTEAQFYITSMIYDAYYMMNKDEWLNQENKEYRDKTEKRFKEYYNEFEGLFKFVSKETRQKIIMGMKNRFFGEGVFLETITFDDWMKHIQEL